MAHAGKKQFSRGSKGKGDGSGAATTLDEGGLEKMPFCPIATRRSIQGKEVSTAGTSRRNNIAIMSVIAADAGRRTNKANPPYAASRFR